MYIYMYIVFSLVSCSLSRCTTATMCTAKWRRRSVPKTGESMLGMQDPMDLQRSGFSSTHSFSRNWCWWTWLWGVPYRRWRASTSTWATQQMKMQLPKSRGRVVAVSPQWQKTGLMGNGPSRPYPDVAATSRIPHGDMDSLI